MRIYTKTGDAGTTGLVGGKRVSKTDSRIQCLGSLDELNATLGLARSLGLPSDIDAIVGRIQSQLFDLGAEVATPRESEYFAESVNIQDVDGLESEIDSWTESLAPLKNFILPGGTSGAATLHLARTICRRAERIMLESQESLGLRSETLVYINRLSDWLFVLARLVNDRAGVQDIKWLGRGER